MENGHLNIIINEMAHVVAQWHTRDSHNRCMKTIKDWMTKLCFIFPLFIDLTRRGILA